MDRINDLDPVETREWRDALDLGPGLRGQRARALSPGRADARGTAQGGALPDSANTPYVNTIPPRPARSRIPGDRRDRATHPHVHPLECDGHGGCGPTSTPGARRPHRQLRVRGDALRRRLQPFLARAAATSTAATSSTSRATARPASTRARFLEGRLTEEQLVNFRQEVDGKGCRSYPHPWLMPDFWQFPTVSMGLGPTDGDLPGALHASTWTIAASPTPPNRKVWAFLGDGEMDEPESLGAISLAAREKLDNLIFVVNCNLQRLDGPVRGNGKIIQELEGDLPRRRLERHQGALGHRLGPAARADTNGVLLRAHGGIASTASTRTSSRKTARTCASTSSASIPSCSSMVADMTDEEIWRLNRGGHDPHKVYAAYAAAMRTRASPPSSSPRPSRATAWARPARARTSPISRRRWARGRICATSATASSIPLTDDKIEKIAVLRAGRRTARRCKYLRERRDALGGYLPARRREAEPLRGAASCRPSSASSRAPASARSRPPWRSCAS